MNLRKIRLCLAVFGVLIAVLSHQPVSGELMDPPADGVDSDVVQRISQLESELDNLSWAIEANRAKEHSCHRTPSRACRNSGGVEAGISLFFAKPHMKESFEATITDFASGSLNLVPFDFEHDVTPRMWLGYFGDSGAGVRARYWQYDHNANPLTATATPTSFPGASSVSVIFPAAISTSAPGDVLSIESGLQVHTLDIEGAQRAKFAGMDVLLSAGFRYASMEQHFFSSITNGSSLNWTREFEGAGLTAGGEVRKPMGSTSFAFVGAARGSLLFGEKQLQRTVVGDVTPVGSRVQPTVMLEDADEVSGIFELSSGLEWSRKTRIGNLFAGVSYETQLWTAAGAPTLTFLGFEGIGISMGLSR